jgi:hypothetical protein
MEWINKISNYDELPESKIWVSIQHGKADYYQNHSALTLRTKVLVFKDTQTAEHFIKHWDESLNDYREACPKGDYGFFVILTTPRGFYADEIYAWEE